MIPLIEILGTIANSVLNHYVKAKAPAEIIDAAIKAVTAIDALHATAVTKDQLESLRG